MSFQHPPNDVIGNAIGTPGRAVPVKKVRAPKSTLRVDETEISRIRRKVKVNFKRDWDVKMVDRILNAIEYLRVNHPGVLLPMTLLFWMCNPGPESDTPSATHNDVLTFAKRVSRYRNRMLVTHATTFYREGHSKTHAGFFRAYINQTELAIYEAPKAGANLVKAHAKAQTLAAAMGNVNKLEVSPDFTPQRKEAAKDYVRLVATIGQQIKGYLPAPTPKPPIPKVP
jgi:hypothetical protein